jgi:hypothetical protein
MPLHSPGPKFNGELDPYSRFGSFVDSADVEILNLQHQLANARRLQDAARAVDPDELGSSYTFSKWRSGQAEDYQDRSKKNRTLAAGPDFDAIPDPDWLDDDDDLAPTLDYDDQGRSRRNQGRAASGKAPASTSFTNGGGIRVQKYKRPAHLQAELTRYEAAVGSPVLRFSDEELGRLGLTKSTHQDDLGFLI